MTDLRTNRTYARMPLLPADLKVRAISGVVLALVALGLDYAGPAPFGVLVVALAVVMAWEWGRLVRSIDIDAAHIVHAASVAIGATLAAFGLAVLGLAALMIGAAAIIPLRFGERAPLSALGVLYVGIPAISMLWLRADPIYGFLAILFIFVTVWTTDTAAYVVGRSVGGPKLWPRISPNKTWSGLAGGVCGAAAAASAFAGFVEGATVQWLVFSGAMLGFVSQLGDLAESALKRAFGAKDTSDLIPGHGGFMDRLDGLVAAASLAALVALLVNAQAPGQALLLGR